MLLVCKKNVETVLLCIKIWQSIY